MNQTDYKLITRLLIEIPQTKLTRPPSRPCNSKRSLRLHILRCNAPYATVHKEEENRLYEIMLDLNRYETVPVLVCSNLKFK